MRPLLLLSFLAVTSAPWTGCVAPYSPDTGRVDAGIVGGTDTEAWPAVGVYMIDGGDSGLCTATLVRPDVLLTAGH